MRARRRQPGRIPLMPFGNFRSIPRQVSETVPFFVSRQRPITATKQRKTAGGIAEDPKHLAQTASSPVPMAGAGRTLFVLKNADVEPLPNADLQPSLYARVRRSQRRSSAPETDVGMSGFLAQHDSGFRAKAKSLTTTPALFLGMLRG